MSRFLVKTTTTHTGCNQMAWRVGAKIVENSDSQVWCLGQKCHFSGPSLDLVNQKLWGWGWGGQALHVLESPPGKADAPQGLKEVSAVNQVSKDPREQCAKAMVGRR